MFGVCPHCGKDRPYKWIGGFHCHEPGWENRYGKIGLSVNWYQPNLGGRWPTDWPVQ